MVPGVPDVEILEEISESEGDDEEEEDDAAQTKLTVDGERESADSQGM